MVRKFALLFLSVSLFSVSAMAEKLIWKQEPFPQNCQEQKGAQKSEGDYLLNKCLTKFGPPMWQIFQESVRQSVGFGTRMNIPYLGASTSRGDWPLEWGGVMKGNKFVPRVAIIRFKFGDDASATTSLVAYKLLPNGKSCRLVDGISGKSENARLRVAASDPKTPCPIDGDIVGR